MMWHGVSTGWTIRVSVLEARNLCFPDKIGRQCATAPKVLMECGDVFRGSTNRALKSFNPIWKNENHAFPLSSTVDGQLQEGSMKFTVFERGKLKVSLIV